MLIRSSRVVLPDGVRPAEIEIRDGRIADVRTNPNLWTEGPLDLFTDLVILPGLVDTHVHINDPGRAEWEGFEHATQAAAAGGVTTLVDMPLNSLPPTTTVAGLEAKRAAARGRCHVDIGFWGGLVPGNAEALEPLVRAGVLGFKCFMCPSGVDEFAHVDEHDLRESLPLVSKLGVPLLAHAELPARLREPAGNPREYRTWLDSRPPDAERGAIAGLVELARETLARVHIVHLATPSVLPAIVQARHSGVAISVETCPHYLTFASESIADGATAVKCAPPIRTAADRDGLWEGLRRGDIDLVATDHSPAPPSLKHIDDGDFLKAWGGIASIQLGISAVWTGASARGFEVDCLARWMSAAPARLAGIGLRKGSIEPGRDADLVVFDPDATWTVDAGALLHRHPVSPYHGMTLRGRVHQTLLRGHIVFDINTGVITPQGRVIEGRHRE